MNSKEFRVIKPEIRILGIDDGKFTPHTTGKVIVVGVVFRGGMWLDGMMHTFIDIDGLDSTEIVAQMVNKSRHRKQLRLIMLNGITLGGFNLVDIKKLFVLTSKPVIALTRKKPDLESIRRALKNLKETNERLRIVNETGEIYEFANKGSKIYMELAGISFDVAKKIVSLASTRSSFPEPLRVAHLVASGITA